MSRKIKVLLVDDQELILKILSDNLIKDQRIEIVGTAINGAVALKKCAKLNPDVIVLDMEMPVMNGLQFLERQMKIKPIPTLVLSSLAHRDSKITLDAFELGAVDFLSKPSGGPLGLQKLVQQLLVKIKIAAAKDVNHLLDSNVDKEKLIQQVPKSAKLEKRVTTNKSILGMGAHEVTNDPSKELKIFALGSCISLALFCPQRGVIGLSHVVLPNSSTDENKSKVTPGYFADTALAAMLKEMYALGCTKDMIFAKIAGGAKTQVDIGDYFGVGERNALAVETQLKKEGIKLLASDTGKEFSRTASMKVGDLNLSLHHPEKGTWKI